MKTGIIGAGFAGVAAAEFLSAAQVSVTLFSAESVLPYYRPRLPELAFGYVEPEAIIMHKREWYDERDIDLRLDTKVTAFTENCELVTADGHHESFDALLIATGGGPVIPPFASEEELKDIFPLWNYQNASDIRNYIKPENGMAIIGGGIIGIESALRAGSKDLPVTIIEKQPYLMAGNFSSKAAEVIASQLRERDIKLILDDSVTKITQNPEHNVGIRTANGKEITCDFVVLAIGATFDTSLAADAGIKTGKRIIVDEYLQTSASGVFAAGDIAELSSHSPCSAKEAIQQGKAAGKNILAYLEGNDMQRYEFEPVPINLKLDDFEIHAIGKIPKDNEFEEKILDFEAMKVYRGCIYENSALAGVQMVGSGKDFMKYKKELLKEKTK